MLLWSQFLALRFAFRFFLCFSFSALKLLVVQQEVVVVCSEDCQKSALGEPKLTCKNCQ